MDQKVTLTAELSSEAIAHLDELAERTQSSREDMLEELILSYVIWTDEMVAGVNQGIEDFRTGETVSHEDAMAMLAATLEKNRP